MRILIASDAPTPFLSLLRDKIHAMDVTNSAEILIHTGDPFPLERLLEQPPDVVIDASAMARSEYVVVTIDPPGGRSLWTTVLSSEIAAMAAMLRARLVLMSLDEVFPGGGPFDTHAVRRASHIRGAELILAENTALAFGGKVIRVSMPFGDTIDSTPRLAKQAASEAEIVNGQLVTKSVRVFEGRLGTPVWDVELATLIASQLDYWDEWPRTVHVGSYETFGFKELLEELVPVYVGSGQPYAGGLIPTPGWETSDPPRALRAYLKSEPLPAP